MINIIFIPLILFKIFFILILLILNIYLLIIEKKDTQIEYQQAGLLDGSIGQRFKQIGAITGTILTGLGTGLSFISYKDNMNSSKRLDEIATIVEQTNTEVSKKAKLYPQLQNFMKDIKAKLEDTYKKQDIANNDSRTVSNILEKLNSLPENSPEIEVTNKLLYSAQEK